MHWRDMLAEVDTLAAGTVTNPSLSGVTYDSRQVRPGTLFVAMRGGSADGNRFVRAAREAECAAVLTDSRETFAYLDSSEFPVALVEHGRKALAQSSAALLHHPERQLSLTAVTGTNGKTTTAFLTEALLASVQRKTVLLGTIETRVNGTVRPSAHTTPESSNILQLFRDGVDGGATEAVMEMSSHALEQGRVYGLPVDVAIFTNLTQDHLDYHGTMAAYAAAKALLFHGVGAAPPRVAVLNRDDPWFPQMHAAAAGCAEVWTYSLNDPSADFIASNMSYAAGETRFTLRCPLGTVNITSALTGRVNVYNLLAAVAAAMGRGLSLNEIVNGVRLLRAVPGRFETVPNMLGITVVVDYAHTDDALRNLLLLARELAGTHRVLTLFGCGGDRDKTKRPKMGRAAAEGSDVVMITSDNPRSEDPQTIADEGMEGIRAAGMHNARIELDRAIAIAEILRMADPGDIVLLAGKGHEKTQTAQGIARPFDDVAVAAAALRALEAARKEAP